MAPLNVLAAVDGSEAAIRACRTATGILALQGGEVRLLVVLSFELDPYTLLGEELEDTPERLRVVSDTIERAVAQPRRIFEDAGCRVSVGHRFGNPADEILLVIEELGPDVVVMGRRGLAAPGRWLLGSVSDRVVHHTKAPVLVGP